MKKISARPWSFAKGLNWKIWLGLFLISSVMSVAALRQNNFEMLKLRDQVYAADKSGKGIEPALAKLQAYVTSHMNTQLTTPNGIYPPIQLSYTYQRLKQQASNNVYHDAQVYCEKAEPGGFYGQSRLNCVEPYIQSHPIKSADIPTALYEFDFVSPAWSPDLAGWSLLVSGLLLGIFMTSFVAQRYYSTKTAR
jgi:hypothetical protein